ncbi:hypothetical protein [Cohnella faecalis]|uniref:Uncharacterized protein n=1 Tax=Cohnella faecalis TaxID=2315694 RepID=A0A398CIS5_9BACL|nr:hypothetical protein [Cohnella faecalis]RIE02285.1 hypothetical protein D3H35_16300 [Cohnella faecalis]
MNDFLERLLKYGNYKVSLSIGKWKGGLSFSSAGRAYNFDPAVIWLSRRANHRNKAEFRAISPLTDGASDNRLYSQIVRSGE